MPTIITKTIDASGNGDYTTFTAAAAAVETIGTSADLVANDEAIVFEAVAGTYSESVTCISSLTTDPTRNVTYKPAAGSEHGGSESAGVRIVSTAYTAVNVRDDNTAFVGLVIANASSFYAHNVVSFGGMNIQGQRLTNCIIACSDSNSGYGVQCYRNSGNGFLGTASNPVTVSNCVFLRVGIHAVPLGSPGSGATIADNLVFSNCTFLSKSAAAGGGTQAFGVFDTNGTLDIKVVNCLNLGLDNDSAVGQVSTLAVTTTGSAGNFGRQSIASWQFPGKGSPYPITATTNTSPGAGDWAIYDATTGALVNVPDNSVIGEGTATGIPTTDINGEERIRDTHADPGAFVAPLRTITRSIDAAGGGDYTTFTAAEAAVATVATDTDMVKRNEAVVFEAEAGTFTTGATLNVANNALTVDATRNVSYTAASGRPVYEYTGAGTGVAFFDPYTRWSGIDVVASSGSAATQVRANSGYGAAQAGTVIENATITSATTAVDCGKFATGHALGTSTEPITLRNLVTKARVAVSQFISGTGHTTGAHCLVVNCTHLGGSLPNQAWNWALTGGMPDASFKIINCANLAQDTSNDANITGGGVDISGSTNNIGNAAAPTSGFRFENIGGGIGSQYTPTTNTSPGAGNWAIYDATTGALINVPDNSVIGEGTATGAPTTDINGEERIRDTHADPGAFVAPLRTITKSIDAAGGGDYTTFTAAEGAVETVATDTDMVKRNEALVFEAVAGTYDGLLFAWTLTTDATRNVTFKPATGSEHGGAFGAGVILQDNTAVTNYIALMNGASTNHCVFEGIAFNVRSGVSSTCTATRSGVGHIWRNCLFSSEGTGTLNRSEDGFSSGSASAPIVYENCVTKGSEAYSFNSNKTGSSMRFVNCTHMTSEQMFGFYTYAASSQAAEIVNCVNLGGGSSLQDTGPTTTTITGSNNVGSASGPFPVALQASSQTWTFSTDPLAASTGSQVIYDASNGAMLNVPGNDAVGEGTATGAPTTDINGEDRIRDTHADPGAFTTQLRTITKSIDAAGGGDYTTFTASEAAATTLPTDTDLVKRNEAVVFEAEAGDYSENLSFFTGSALTCDATRNFKWTHAAGAEHGGQFESGANITGYCLIRESFTVVEGLSVSNGYTAAAGSDGSIVRNSMLYSPTGNAIRLSRGGTAIDPVTVENCVAKADATRPVDIRSEGAGVDSHWRVVNCTAFVGTGYIAFNIGLSSSDNLYLELTNNLVIGDLSYYNFGGATLFLTGSDNVGPNPFPFPVAQQALSQSWTSTTDPLAASTGSQVIYDATNGAMVNAPGNDAVGVVTATGAPTTDINGEERIRDTHADPGAFVAPLRTITKSIDAAGGGDYTTFTAAEAAVTTLPTDTDMVKRNEALVFEADAGTYVEILNVDSTLVSDATRNVTYRCADRSNRPVIGNGTLSTPVRMRDDFTRFDGIDSFDTDGGAFKLFDSQVGIVVENCEATSDGAGVYLNKSGANIGSAAAPCVVRNVVTKARFGVNASGADLFVEVFNCTFLPGTTSPAGQTNYQFFATGSSACKLVNCIVLDSRADRQLAATATVTGSNNIGVLGGVSGQLFSTNGVGSEKTPTTNTSPGAGDWAIYDATTGALINVPDNSVIGEGTATGAPATDINGEDRIRLTYADPGAFTTDLRTITRTVDTNGVADYTSMITLEASLVSDMPEPAKRNEALVYEFAAGNHDTNPTGASFNITTSTTTEWTAKNNITWRPQAGAEHGGDFSQGAKIYASDPTLNGSTSHANIDVRFFTLDGLVMGVGRRQVSGYEAILTSRTVPQTYRDLLCEAPVKPASSGWDGSSEETLLIENCVVKVDSSVVAQDGIKVTTYGTGGIRAIVRNCTVIGSISPSTGLAVEGAGAGQDKHVSFYNNLVDGGRVGVTFHNAVNHQSQFFGSNNYATSAAEYAGGASADGDLGFNQWTFTTDTDETTSPSTGSQVVYDDETGRLYDVPGNDAWQILTDLTGVPATDIDGITRSASGYNPGAFEETATLGILATGTGALFSLSGISAALVSTDALGLADLSAIAGAAEAGASANAAATATLSALRGAGAAGMAMQAVAQAAMATPSAGNAAAVVTLEAIGLATLQAIGSSASAVASLEAVGAAVLHALQSQGLVALEVNGQAVASLAALRSASLGEVLLLPGPVTEVTLSTEALQAIVSPYIIIATDPNR